MSIIFYDNFYYQYWKHFDFIFRSLVSLLQDYQLRVLHYNEDERQELRRMKQKTIMCNLCSRLPPRRPDKLGYTPYPLFLHKLFNPLQDIKRSTGVDKVSGAHLNRAGSSQNEL